MEEWRDIKGYEGLYQVSNEGRVKSLERDWTVGKGGNRHKDETIMKLQKSPRGYYRLTLTKDGIETYKLVHRLVAEAFIENPNGYPYINHKDENPSNNSVENLEWCTPFYNNTYNDRHLKAAPKISKSRMGQPSPTKGKKMSDETKKKLSESLKGRIPWNKGLKTGKNDIQKIRV